VLRWAALAWLAVYLPAYTAAYGLLNFLFLCNLGVIVTCLGVWAGSPLLISSQGVAALPICAAWCLDAGYRLLTGDHLFGFTAYMWDPRFPLFTRLLSLYHVAWPLVLVHALRRLGYDPHGYPLQVAIAAVGIGAARLTAPGLNINFAHAEPFFGASLGPAPVHLAIVLGVLSLIVYGATHRTLRVAMPAYRGSAVLARGPRDRLGRVSPGLSGPWVLERATPEGTSSPHCLVPGRVGWYTQDPSVRHPHSGRSRPLLLLRPTPRRRVSASLRRLSGKLAVAIALTAFPLAPPAGAGPGDESDQTSRDEAKPGPEPEGMASSRPVSVPAPGEEARARSGEDASGEGVDARAVGAVVTHTQATSGDRPEEGPRPVTSEEEAPLTGPGSSGPPGGEPAADGEQADDSARPVGKPARIWFPPPAPEGFSSRAVGNSVGQPATRSVTPLRPTASAGVRPTEIPTSRGVPRRPRRPIGSELPDVSADVAASELPVPLATSAETSFDSIDFDLNAAETGSYYIPPDSHSAVGPSHVVNVANVTIQYHDKTGTVTGTEALPDFFLGVTPLTDTFDPRVIYDQYEGRFVVITLEATDVGDGEAANTSRLFIAVSDDSTPSGWTVTSVNTLTNIGGSDHWLDYPSLAVDDEAVYVVGNMFRFSNDTLPFEYGGVRLWILDKGAGSGGFYDGGVASLSQIDPIPGTGEALTTQAAHMFGTAPSAVGTFLVGYSGLTLAGDEFIQVIRVDDPLGTPTLTHQFVPVGDIDDTDAPMPGAPQADSTAVLDTIGRRAMSAAWRDDALWLTTTVMPPAGVDIGQATAHWVKLDTSTLGSTSLAAGGNVGGEDIASGTFTFAASIAAGPHGDAAVGFSASAATTYAGAYVVFLKTRGTAEELRAGTDFYERAFGGSLHRWGDYSSVAVDPTDGCYWVYNEYAMSRGTLLSGEEGRWRTANGKWCTMVFDDGFESGNTSTWSQTVP
jgi:hypothetical protein